MTGVVVVGIDGIQCVVTSYLLPFLLFYEMPGGGEYTGPTHTGCPKIKETLFIWPFLSSEKTIGIALMGVSDTCFCVDFQNVKKF